MPLYFTGHRQRAAEHVLRETGLDTHPHLARFISPSDSLLTIRFYPIDLTPAEQRDGVLSPDEWRYSSGEQAILKFLQWMGDSSSWIDFHTIDDPALDSRCRSAVWQAFGLAVSAIQTVATLP